ncbi:hypothetical protein Tco_0489755 [Tanacetum coccineum]
MSIQNPEHQLDPRSSKYNPQSSAFVAKKEWITSSARPGVAVVDALEEEVLMTYFFEIRITTNRDLMAAQSLFLASSMP